MKLSLIREATLDEVQRRIPLWAKQYFGGDANKAVDVVRDVVVADPTKGKYSEWILKQYLSKTIRLPEDAEKIKQNLTLFEKKKSKLAEKDINRYSPASLAKTLDGQFGLTKSERKQARRGRMHLPPGAELVLDDGKIQVVKITDAEASSALCSGTEWCTANVDTADEYLEDGPLYLVYVDGERTYLIHYETEQFMDVYDEDIGIELKAKLIKLLEKATGKPMSSMPELSLEYAQEVVKGRWPEGEKSIASHATSAMSYAKDIIKGRWLLGEQAISRHPIKAVEYAKDVVGGRWPEAEGTIKSSPVAALLYARYVIKGRWPEAESMFSSYPGIAVEYARHVIKGRWPEGEEAIATSVNHSLDYAANVVHGRVPAVEANIITNSNFAVEYAIRAIKGRFPQAEGVILASPKDNKRYKEFLASIGEPLPE